MFSKLFVTGITIFLLFSLLHSCENRREVKEKSAEAYFEEYLNTKEKNTEEAFNILIRAVEQGHPDACWKLYTSFESKRFEDIQFSEDLSNKLFLLENSPESATRNLFLANALVDNSQPKESKIRGRAILKTLSEANNVEAWNKYIYMCESGEGGDVDLPSSYFYSYFLTLLVDPDTDEGLTIWEKRHELESKLNSSKVKAIRSEVIEQFKSGNAPDYYSFASDDELIEIHKRILNKCREYEPLDYFPVY